jgi:hypothetical protein
VQTPFLGDILLRTQEMIYAMPKRVPDHLFGFPAVEEDNTRLKHFGKDFLEKLQAISFLTTPIKFKWDLYFPYAVHEAKSENKGMNKDTNNIHFQAATTAAICIDILTQFSAFPDSKEALGASIPVIAFTSIGAKWEVFICYRDDWTVRFATN